MIQLRAVTAARSVRICTPLMLMMKQESIIVVDGKDFKNLCNEADAAELPWGRHRC